MEHSQNYFPLFQTQILMDSFSVYSYLGRLNLLAFPPSLDYTEIFSLASLLCLPHSFSQFAFVTGQRQLCLRESMIEFGDIFSFYLFCSFSILCLQAMLRMQFCIEFTFLLVLFMGQEEYFWRNTAMLTPLSSATRSPSSNAILRYFASQLKKMLVG